MKLCLPKNYEEQIEYLEDNALYYTGKEKEGFRRLLLKASDSYCMYCGTSLINENAENMQLEHSVDKEGNEGEPEKEKCLKQCKYNLAAACYQCNMIYKKRVEKMDLNKYDLPLECPDTCNRPCDGYSNVRKDYSGINSIKLQPAGLSVDGVDYVIRYNLLRDLYEPDIDTADELHKFFIERHIKRFHLNREKLSRNVINLCVDIVDISSMADKRVSVSDFLNHYKIKKQPNVIGKLFLEFLLEKFVSKSVEDLESFCRMLVLASAIF